MKIWILTSQFPPTVIGGIARYVENAAAMFAGAGHQVTVLAADAADGETTLPGGARLVRFAPRGHLLRAADPPDRSAAHPAFPHNILSYWPALSYELAGRARDLALRDGPPDVIECQEYGALPYYLIQRRLVEHHPLSGVPLVVNLHSPDFALTRANQEPRYRFPAYWTERMEKFCLLAADGLLASSRFMLRELARELPEVAGRVAVAPLPYPPLPRAHGVPTPGDLVYVGRLQALKGVPPLVEACAGLWSQGRDFRLTLMGGDTIYAPAGAPMSAYLRARYRRWVDAGRLVIQPDQPLADAALWARLASAWAVLVPSTWENFPNVCIEAMGLGKLVIASTSGGQAEMVGDDGQAGILFDWGRPGDCAAAIERALGMSADAVRALGEAARERITRMTSFDAVLAQRIASFEQVIAGMPRERTIFPALSPAGQRTSAPDQNAPAGDLSVVISYTGGPAVLAETLASAAALRPPPLEVLVVATGALEPADEAALEALRARDGALRLLRAPGHTHAMARRHGAAAAAGAYVALIPAGDCVAPDFAARAALVLDRYRNVSVVYTWTESAGDPPRCQPAWNAELPYLLLRDMLPASVVVRRDRFLQHCPAGDVPHDCDEWSTWIGMVEAGEAGVCMPDVLVRSQPAAAAAGPGLNDDAELTRLERIAARHPRSVARHAQELIGLLNANGPALTWDHPAAQPVNYRRRYEELLRRYNMLKGYLWFLRPVVALLRRVRRGGV